jgi:hypothetical protein
LKKGAGIPNIFPYKEQMMNSLERKEKMDQEMKDHLKSIA